MLLVLTLLACSSSEPESEAEPVTEPTGTTTVDTSEPSDSGVMASDEFDYGFECPSDREGVVACCAYLEAYVRCKIDAGEDSDVGGMAQICRTVPDFLADVYWCAAEELDATDCTTTDPSEAAGDAELTCFRSGGD